MALPRFDSIGSPQRAWIMPRSSQLVAVALISSLHLASRFSCWHWLGWYLCKRRESATYGPCMCKVPRHLYLESSFCVGLYDATFAAPTVTLVQLVYHFVGRVQLCRDVVSMSVPRPDRALELHFLASLELLQVGRPKSYRFQTEHWLYEPKFHRPWSGTSSDQSSDY